MIRVTRVSPRRRGGDEAHHVFGGSCHEEAPLSPSRPCRPARLRSGAAAVALRPTLASSTRPLRHRSSTPSPVRVAALGDAIAPTVSAVAPASAPNDIDTPVTITGAGFAAASADGCRRRPPTRPDQRDLRRQHHVDRHRALGRGPRHLRSQGRQPRWRDGSLAGAFTVTQGIGQWNGGDLFGGEVRQILMKPGDPSTLYAPPTGSASSAAGMPASTGP